MGIKDLWPLLNPYCERKPLYELQGKVVAIDLAGWICESLCVVDYEVQAKFYLRNLFFRTCYLLLSGITPVYVLEGTAPALKHQVIAKRNQIQFRGAKPRKNTQEDDSNGPSAVASQKSKNKGRTRFNYVLKQCEELVRSMGLRCVQGAGEAEAFCAHLNACDLVDGVISQDSDCFAYGARRVFRNFTLSKEGTAGSIGGSVDIYDLNTIQKSMDFGRNKIIVMALLCGCDYCPDGVDGVGKDGVQKLFSLYSEVEILERVRSWRKNNDKYTELEIKVDDKSLCSSCGHYGRVQNHTKNGCAQCRMSVGCDSSVWKDKRLAIKSELQIRKKALINDDFPSQEIIDEFMQEPTGMSALQLNWCQPNLIKFVKMMSSQLQWDEIYCFQKLLPLLTRWQLHHFSNGTDTAPLHVNVSPDFIKKKRAPKGVPSYEIIWNHSESCFDGLIPDQQLRIYTVNHKEQDSVAAMQSLWSTIEPIDLVEKAYPELVERFIESKSKRATKKSKATQEGAEKPKKVAKKRTAKKDVSISNVDDDDETKSCDRPKSNRQPKKLKKNDKLPTLDRFLQKKLVHPAYESPKIKTSSKPLNLSAFSSDLNDSFASMSISHDLSQIIDDMISRPPKVTEFNGRKLRYNDVVSNAKTRLDYAQEKNVINNVNVNDKRHEKDENLEKHEVSLDEFDLMVMENPCKEGVDVGQVKSHRIFNKALIPLNDCSTPVGISRRAPKNEFSFKKHNHSPIVTSFFAADPDNEIDLFEQSIDYRNMLDDNDVISDDDSGDQQGDNSDGGENKSNDVILIDDTFDRLVGLA